MRSTVQRPPAVADRSSARAGVAPATSSLMSGLKAAAAASARVLRLAELQSRAAARSPLQRARSRIAPFALPVDLGGLEAHARRIEAELDELETDEQLDRRRLGAWLEQLETRLETLRQRDPGTRAFDRDEITNRADDLAKAVHAVVITLANLRNTLNNSLEGLEAVRGEQGYTKPAATEASTYASPYAGKAGTYDHDFGGAIVLVEDNFVVVVEHYQLKHNPDLKVLYAGGEFKGKRGSTLPGGWEAHRTTYAPQVLQHVKTLLPASPRTLDEKWSMTGAKARLADIDAYFGVAIDGQDWIIHYHGNPPA